MRIVCPQCHSSELRVFNHNLVCNRCLLEFNPKCPNCNEGELLTRDDEHWECSFCSWEADTEDFNLPDPETMLYSNRPRSRAGSSKGGGGSFWGDLLSSIGSSIMEEINKAGKK